MITGWYQVARNLLTSKAHKKKTFHNNKVGPIVIIFSGNHASPEKLGTQIGWVWSDELKHLASSWLHQGPMHHRTCTCITYHTHFRAITRDGFIPGFQPPMMHIRVSCQKAPPMHPNHTFLQGEASHNFSEVKTGEIGAEWSHCYSKEPISLRLPY